MPRRAAARIGRADPLRCTVGAGLVLVVAQRCGEYHYILPCENVTFSLDFCDTNKMIRTMKKRRSEITIMTKTTTRPSKSNASIKNSTTPAAAIRALPVKSFVRLSDLPGADTARRKAVSRAVESGELLKVRRGLYYRGKATRYGMTHPSTADVVNVVMGSVGVGLAGFSAAREWGVTTQVPASVHVATLKKVEGFEGVKQTVRSNLARADLNAKEIALLELMREPDVYVEAGWDALVAAVRDAIVIRAVRVDRLRFAGHCEYDLATGSNIDRLLANLNESTPVVASAA